jgi:cephalosporin hydroxylase
VGANLIRSDKRRETTIVDSRWPSIVVSHIRNLNEQWIAPLLLARRTRAFAIAWYRSPHTWQELSWLGVPLQKNPLDLWIYQEIMTEIRPALIIETGTLHGGSALYLAHLCDLLGRGQVISIDIGAQPILPDHPRVRFLPGSSVEPGVIEQVRSLARALEPVLVILDSDHSEPHVSAELEAYSAFVTPGSYLIVEDTNVNGHPVFPSHGPGPMEAVREFLKTHREFQPDTYRERLMLTLNPRGYLKRAG